MFAINRTVSEGYAELMRQFSTLMVSIHSELVKKPAPMEEFVVYLMGLRCNMMLGAQELQEGDLKKDWTGTFEKLSSIKAWDCFNYSLMRVLIDQYLSGCDAYKRLKAQIDDYDGKVEAFLYSTLLVDFLDVYREMFPDDLKYSKGCHLLKVKVDRELPGMTLADYRSHKSHLMSEFRLQNCVLHLASYGTGCAIFHWYLPQQLVSHVREVCKELQPDFGQAGVIELCIDDTVLYQVSLFSIEQHEHLCT
jgi:hypothetical protein